MKEMEIYYLMA